MVNDILIEYSDNLNGKFIPSGSTGQGHDQNSLGFGYIYYGLSKIIKPKTVVVIGSGTGFSPSMFALGGSEKVYFIDASYNEKEHGYNRGWGGTSKWTSDGEKVFDELNISENVELIVSESKDVQWSADIDILLIDGDHTYEGCKSDWLKYGPYAKYVLFHDSLHEENNTYKWGVKKLVDELSNMGYSIINLPFYAGLSILENK